MTNNTQNKLELYEPHSRLAYANSMSPEILSEFSTHDVSTYELEYSTLTRHKQEDTTKAQHVIKEVQAGLDFLFGKDSKQAKYITRAFIKGETICDVHYAKFSDPHNLSDLLDGAKLRCGNQSTKVGLSETNVDELNDAIAYLTEKGFTFGRDFTAHNAVDMAKAQYLEQCFLDEDLISLSDTIEDCTECDSTYEKGSVNLSSGSLSCRCYDDKSLDIVFESNRPMFGVIQNG
tara:strand:- start:131 stop:829 length:699 start_codon:yes stop_codon:yes gene_type:complete